MVIVLNLKPVEHCWVAAQATLKRMGKQHGNKPLLIWFDLAELQKIHFTRRPVQKTSHRSNILQWQKQTKDTINNNHELTEARRWFGSPPPRTLSNSANLRILIVCTYLKLKYYPPNETHAKSQAFSHHSGGSYSIVVSKEAQRGMFVGASPDHNQGEPLKIQGT